MRLETLNLEMTIDLWRIVSHGFDTNKMPLWETWTRHKLSTSLCAWARAGRELWARNGRPSKNVNHCPSICCRFFFLLRTFQCFFSSVFRKILQAWNCKFVAGSRCAKTTEFLISHAFAWEKTESERTNIVVVLGVLEEVPRTTFKIANLVAETDGFPFSACCAWFSSKSLKFSITRLYSVSCSSLTRLE